MFRAQKRIEISGSHSLDLPYPSKCSRVHGHNWIIEVVVVANSLDQNGMVLDFSVLKRVVDEYDHQNLNEIMSAGNPTAENLAREIGRIVQDYLDSRDRGARVEQVMVQESEGNKAWWIL